MLFIARSDHTSSNETRVKLNWRISKTRSFVVRITLRLKKDETGRGEIGERRTLYAGSRMKIFLFSFLGIVELEIGNGTSNWVAS